MSTITSLNANDNGATSRGVINTNTDNLNADKLENSSLTGATAKTTPVDADTMPINDSAASNALKKVTWANIKATAKTYFDTLYIPFTYLDTDGTMAANSDTKVASQKAVRTYVAANGSTDWNTIATAPTTITNLGQRSYSILYPSVDLTSTIHPGMRLRTTRTVSAPTQCTSLNGTTQYYSKTSPAGMTFTDDFAVSAWVKLTSYSAGGQMIVSRSNGTSGWDFSIESSGRVQILGRNASGSNYRGGRSYQSIPLNRWVHVAAQNDMSTFTASPTTIYTMIDGVDVPTEAIQGGTNPTALVQAGNLEIGSWSGGLLPFPGKIAQVAIFNAKVTQDTMRGYISQGLSGSETSLISAYSFNNAITDLNTTNANNLTAQGSAVATNADSPFATNSYGTETGTLDYALVQAVTFSTNTTVTVQVPWGCTIPTSGGVTTSAYSSVKAPYGWVIDNSRWEVSNVQLATRTQVSPVANTWYNLGGKLVVPVGSWILGHKTTVYSDRAVAGDIDSQATVSTTSSTETDIVATTTSRSGGGTIITTTHQLAEYPIVTSAATAYYVNGRTRVASGANFIMGGNDKFYVIPAGL